MREKPSAKAKAVAFLSRREHSKAELSRKLSNSGLDAHEIEEAVHWLERTGLQSDDRFTNSLVRRRSSRYGDRAISSELSLHGISAKGNLQDLDSDLAPESERVFSWLQRRYTSKLQSLVNDEGELDRQALFTLKVKVFRSTSAKGFEQNNIEKGWRLFIDEFLGDQ